MVARHIKYIISISGEYNMDLCEYPKRRRSASVASRYADVLLSKAKKESGEAISFPAHTSCIEECITRMEDKLMLWYNDAYGNTKTVFIDLE